MMTKYKQETSRRKISDEELLDDLKRVFSMLQKKGKRLTFRSYQENGKYSSPTYRERFGSWNKALAMAGLEINVHKYISNIQLFNNIKTVWIRKGKRPVFSDISKTSTKYSAGTYILHFGSWSNALKKFDEYINDDSIDTKESNFDNKSKGNSEKEKNSRRIPGNISEKMRFRILVRDGFTCSSCGASPSKSSGVKLNVVHIIPWSKGGETKDENLETKCGKCNLGK